MPDRDTAPRPSRRDDAHTGPTLTPSEDLLFEVVIARHRLGDTPYHLESRHRRTAEALAAKGLIEVDSGNVENTIRVSLTVLGELVGISDTYTPPALRAECPSFYMGPMASGHRVDCDKRRFHSGKHRWVYGADLGMEPVRWTDAQAGGRDHPGYAPALAEAARMEAGHRAALRAAIAEGRIDWTTGQIKETTDG